MIKTNTNIKVFFLLFITLKLIGSFFFRYTKNVYHFYYMEHYLAIFFAITLVSKSCIFHTELSGTEISFNTSEHVVPIIKLEVGFVSDKLICDTASKHTFQVKGRLMVINKT